VLKLQGAQDFFLDEWEKCPYRESCQYASLVLHQGANNESSEVFDIIKPGQRVKIKGYRQ